MIEPKKYRFRKMYFVVTDNVIIGRNTWATQAFQYKDKAQAIADQMHTTRGMHIINEIPLDHKVHGFYLVHESLYDEVLKEHCKNDLK